MTAIVEKLPDFKSFSNEKLEAFQYIFLKVLSGIVNADDKYELQFAAIIATNKSCELNGYTGSDFFEYGFGGSHFWLYSKDLDERIVFVEL